MSRSSPSSANEPVSGEPQATTPIRAVFFDAVGTLIHPHPPAQVVYADVGRRRGSCYTVEAIAPRFTRAFQLEDEIDRAAGWRTSGERELRRWRTIVGRVFDDLTDVEACFQELYRHFSGPAAWRCQAEVRSLLEELAAAGYRLGLASNYDQRLRSVWEGLPDLHPCRHLVISSEIGWRKPALQFFEALSRETGLPAHHTMYVGDDPLNDYEGATTAGMHALLFDPSKKHVSFAGARIACLSELRNVLASVRARSVSEGDSTNPR